MAIDKQFFSEQVIYLDKEMLDKEDAISYLAKELHNKNAVTDKFATAVINREENYPTGLALAHDFGVAIPHTDSEFIIKNQIGVLRLNHPVKFRQMGSNTDYVQVKMIFMLCLKEAHKQLEMLQNLMTLFSDSKKIEQLNQVDSKESFINLMCKE